MCCSAEKSMRPICWHASSIATEKASSRWLVGECEPRCVNSTSLATPITAILKIMPIYGPPGRLARHNWCLNGNPASSRWRRRRMTHCDFETSPPDETIVWLDLSRLDNGPQVGGVMAAFVIVLQPRLSAKRRGWVHLRTTLEACSDRPCRDPTAQQDSS